MYVLTLIAPAGGDLTASAVRVLATDLGASHHAWLSPDEAADLFLPHAPSLAAIDTALAGARIDAVVQPVAGRAKRLLVADMDGTVLAQETLDQLAAELGLGPAVAAITRRSMDGEVDFATSLAQRAGMFKGQPIAALPRAWARVSPTPGAAELVATMRAHGAVCVLVTGGLAWFAARAAALLGFDQVRANTLLDDGDVFTGAVAQPVLDRAAKRDALRHFAQAHGVALEQTLAVGDGANDLDMLGGAGLGVAYHAAPAVARAARARIDHADLRALLFIQGYAPPFQTSVPRAPLRCSRKHAS